MTACFPFPSPRSKLKSLFSVFKASEADEDHDDDDDDDDDVQSRKRYVSHSATASLGAIHVDPLRLRQSSKYFAVCMSTRWSGPAQREFFLEVHTDVIHYIDCFSRIHFPYKPIDSMADSIELFKVASQLQFDHVLENSPGDDRLD